MKTSISHLPEAMQADLRKIQAELIPKYAEIEMIILFGSYARGDWQIDEYMENGVWQSLPDSYQRGAPALYAAAQSLCRCPL